MALIKRNIALLFGVVFSVSALSQDDHDDQFIRENPDLEYNRSIENIVEAIDLSAYPFLDESKNVITLNGADWSMVSMAAGETDDRALRIVHIGDSHIQADMATGITRRLLQQRFGSTGRGLIAPLKIAGTNEPRDYIFKSNSSFQCEKLLAHDWTMPMGFTGVSISPEQQEFDFTVSAHEAFERIYIYYTGSSLNVLSVQYDGSPLVYASNDGLGCLEVGLPFPCEEVSLILSSFGDMTIHGMELTSDVVGVAYHTIGINGATYSNYNRIPEFGRSIAMLEPQLIILSLGTNEAFGRLEREEFLSSLDALVSELRNTNPEACILLTTPSECHRRQRRRKKSVFTVNDNVAKVRDMILNYGKTNNIAVYDWYAAAGGGGSSEKWVKAGLFSRDHIHCSLTGYEVEGQMVYNALINSFGFTDN